MPVCASVVNLLAESVRWFCRKTGDVANPEARPLRVVYLRAEAIAQELRELREGGVGRCLHPHRKLLALGAIPRHLHTRILRLPVDQNCRLEHRVPSLLNVGLGRRSRLFGRFSGHLARFLCARRSLLCLCFWFCLCFCLCIWCRYCNVSCRFM